MGAKLHGSRSSRPRVVEYRPGTCNIGPRGRRLRYLGAILIFGLTGLLYVALRTAGLPTWTRFLLFLPLFAGFVALLEARLHFCVYLAARGVFDLR